MANSIIYVFVVLLFINSSSFDAGAQSTSNVYTTALLPDSVALASRKNNIIKANTLSYLIWDYNISYERLAHTAHRSFVVKVDYNYFTSNEFTLRGLTFRPGIRCYLTKKRWPPAGYYIQPFFVYGEYTIHDKRHGTGVHVSQAGGGLIGGIQWAIGNRVTVEIFLGCEYANVTASNTYRVRGVIESFRPMLGATTGFRF